MLLYNLTEGAAGGREEGQLLLYTCAAHNQSELKAHLTVCDMA